MPEATFPEGLGCPRCNVRNGRGHCSAVVRKDKLRVVHADEIVRGIAQHRANPWRNVCEPALEPHAHDDIGRVFREHLVSALTVTKPCGESLALHLGGADGQRDSQPRHVVQLQGKDAALQALVRLDPETGPSRAS